MKYRNSLYSSLCAAVGIAAPALALAQDTELEAPFGESTEPVFIVATIIQALLGVVGAVTLLVFIWGGFNMIFAAGNQERIAKARTTLIWAVIGLGVILSSYGILQYIFNLFTAAAST